MIRRLILVSACLLATTGVALSSPAGAQSYAGCVATISTTTPTAGQTVTIKGTGAQASTAITASIAKNSDIGDSVIGTSTSDAAGAFSISAIIPKTASGASTVYVGCGGTDVATIGITVGAAPAAPTLPATGSDSFPLAGVGIAALAIGSLVLVGARLRSKSASI